MNMKKLLFGFLIFSIQFSASAYVGLDVLPSTEWQKSELEKSISTRLERRLDTIIREKQYIIDVSISTSLPQKPDFKLAPAKPQQIIKFSNVTPDKSTGDYIVFSKFGLEVPIISALEETSDNNKKSELEYLWKYNQSVDVFKNLEDVKIAISLSDKLTTIARTKIKEIVESMDIGLGEVKPTYEFNYINLALDPAPEIKKPEEKIKDKSFMDRVEQFGNAIGLLLATILLGIIAFLLLKQYEGIKKNEQKSQAQPAPVMNQEKEEKEKDAPSPFPAMPGAQDNDNHTSGIERFNAYLEKNPEGAYFLVRKWIKSDSTNEKKALFGLVKTLDNTKLLTIFENISLNDREKWKATINEKEAQTQDFKEVDHFISQQVVEEIIVPSVVDDNQLLELVMEISDENAALFIQKNPELAPYFLQLLSAKHTGTIFKYLEQSLIKSLLKVSSKLKKEDILNKIEDLKNSLSPFTSKATDNTFIKKLVELIPLASANTDEALFESLREASAMDAIKKLSKKYYPSFLIQNLPENIISSILSVYRTDKKTELLYSLDDDTRETFMSALGPDGSTIKEMIKMELENIESNPRTAKDLKARSSLIWEEFVNHARHHINLNYDNQSEYQDTLGAWLGLSSLRPDLSIVNGSNRVA